MLARDWREWISIPSGDTIKKDFNKVEENIEIDDIKKDLIQRDKIDSNRALSPLKRAEDAIMIDTSNCTIDEQVDKIYNYIKRV